MERFFASLRKPSTAAKILQNKFKLRTRKQETRFLIIAVDRERCRDRRSHSNLPRENRNVRNLGSHICLFLRNRIGFRKYHFRHGLRTLSGSYCKLFFIISRRRRACKSSQAISRPEIAFLMVQMSFSIV